MAENPAAFAYEAYGKVTGGKNYQGLPMPAWQDLPEKIKEAWWAAVVAVVEHLEGTGDLNAVSG